MAYTLTRRTVLSAAPLFAAAQTSRIRLGGPVFLKSEDPRELAREHRRLGYSAAYCPPAASLDSGVLRGIREAFAAEDVVIAEVGAWKNMLDPDAAKRSENLRYVTERLALSEGVASRCCVNIAGSYNPALWYGPHPRNLTKDFFEATVENCRKVIDAVKPRQTKFSVEMMPWSLPNGPDAYVDLIRAVDRAGFGVHLDVCNIVNSPERYYDNAALINDCFAKLGRWTLSCHAKDLEWMAEFNVHFKEVVPGRGQIDYRAYLKGLAALPSQPPLMLEHLKTPEEYLEGANYIRRIGSELKIGFA